jgi:hypothetical protein
LNLEHHHLEMSHKALYILTPKKSGIILSKVTYHKTSYRSTEPNK